MLEFIVNVLYISWFFSAQCLGFWGGEALGSGLVKAIKVSADRVMLLQ